jgi:hypothetical protein
MFFVQYIGENGSYTVDEEEVYNENSSTFVTIVIQTDSQRAGIRDNAHEKKKMLHLVFSQFENMKNFRTRVLKNIVRTANVREMDAVKVYSLLQNGTFETTGGTR